MTGYVAETRTVYYHYIELLINNRDDVDFIFILLCGEGELFIS
jgi:hypothetical protein